MEVDSKETNSFARQKAKQSYEIVPWVVETVLLPLPANRNPQPCSSPPCHIHLYHFNPTSGDTNYVTAGEASKNCSEVSVRKRADVPCVSYVM